MNLQPKTITAFLVGLKSKFAIFSFQRSVNTYRGEPLLAILPGVALQERRREMAILRSVGARPIHIFSLLATEATLLATAGAALGVALLYSALAAAQPLITEQYGLHIAIAWPSPREFIYLGLVIGGGLIAGTIPAIRAYRRSLADGMAPRT